jgi:Protein of unknown function (DUF3309)
MIFVGTFSASTAFPQRDIAPTYQRLNARPELDCTLQVEPCDSSEATMRTIILIIVILLLVGALPTWPYSSGWGYYPSSGLGLVLVIILILVAIGGI